MKFSKSSPANIPVSTERIRHKPYKALLIGGYGHAGDALQACLRDNRFAGLHGGVGFEGEPPPDSFAKPLEISCPHIRSAPSDAMQSCGGGVAIVSTRPKRIAEMVGEALRHGYTVIAEKPLATTREDLLKLFDTWLQCPQPLCAILSMRSLPVFRTARALIDSGAIGKIRLINVRKSYRWGERPGWFGRPSEDGGLFAWIGIHAFDIAAFLTGAHFTQVAAQAVNACHPTHPQAWDTACATAGMEGGILATLSIDMHRPLNSDPHGDDWCRVVGDAGCLEADAKSNTCRLLKSTGSTEIIHPTEEPGYLDSFLAMLRTGERTESFTEEAFHLTEVSLAADRSAREHCIRKISPRKWKP